MFHNRRYELYLHQSITRSLSRDFALPASLRPTKRGRGILWVMDWLQWFMVRWNKPWKHNATAATQSRAARWRKMLLLVSLLSCLHVTAICLVKSAPPTPPSGIFTWLRADTCKKQSRWPHAMRGVLGTGWATKIRYVSIDQPNHFAMNR